MGSHETPELIQAKSEIESLNEELEQRVIERTNDLRVANEELRNEIAERKQAEEALDERLRFEALVSELSAAFANLSPNEVDREIDKWLRTLAEFLGVDRASFFQFEEDWTTLYRSHSYTVPGIEPLPQPPIGMKEQFPWITDQLRQGVTVKWSRIPDDMPEEAGREKEYAASLGAKSGLNIPVAMGGSVICAITFTSIANYHDWPDAMVARLRLVGEMFAAAVERKRAEAALSKSEEQFRQMAENIREVFWLTTADLSKMLYISPAYEAVWGRSRESLYREPRSFSAAIHAEDRSRVIAIVERDRENGFEVEYRVVRPDGSIRWIRDRGFPIKDESGRFYRVAGIAEDITEEKQAEDALRRGEDRIRLIIDTVPVMAWSLRPDGVVDFLNQRWMDYAGLSLAEYINDPTSPVHPADIPRVVEKWLADMVAGEPNEDEMRLRRADGEYRWFLVRNAPLRDGQGEIVKWYGASIEIEDRKHAEEKLKATSEQLRALSARLRSAREEEATRIAREIHDELGSSLTRLKWDLELISKENLGTQDHVELERLGQKIDEMIQLMDATIDTVRRIAAELRPSLLDDLGLIPALRWGMDRFRERTGVETNFASSRERIDLTPERSTAVFRIVEEALTNVMRHAQATRVDVKLEPDNDILVLTIRDNGRGITAAEKMDRLSLGLLSMRERANILGGQTDITANEQGTIITVRLPISDGQ